MRIIRALVGAVLGPLVLGFLIGMMSVLFGFDLSDDAEAALGPTAVVIGAVLGVRSDGVRAQERRFYRTYLRGLREACDKLPANVKISGEDALLLHEKLTEQAALAATRGGSPLLIQAVRNPARAEAELMEKLIHSTGVEPREMARASSEYALTNLEDRARRVADQLEDGVMAPSALESLASCESAVESGQRAGADPDLVQRVRREVERANAALQKRDERE